MIEKEFVLNLIVIKFLFVPNLYLVLSDPSVFVHFKRSMKILILNTRYFHKISITLFTSDTDNWAQSYQLL